MRVSFQFLGQGGSTFRPISTYLGRSFQGLVHIRPVLAGVPETYRTNLLEVLKLSLAVGPFILGLGARKESASHHFVRVSFLFLARVLAAGRSF